MEMIDLSMTIKPHWRWPVAFSLRSDFGTADFRSSMAQLPAHAFTHVDTPLHCRKGGVPVDKLPANAYSGSAAVVNLSAIQPNQGISAQDLADHGKHIRPADIVLLKTCWDTHFHPDSKEYWSQAPYLTDEAAMWLAEKKPRVVGFDFPQDYPLKDVNRKSPATLEESTAHKHLLYHGVLFIEYLANMAAVTADRVNLIALPLRLEGFEGCPARVVVLEG
jgi:kynurenine formamidase